MTQAWIDIVARSFRREYKFPVSAAKNWFPGHMNRGLKDMQRRVKNVDCIIEVHDARIPLSGRNSAFKETISGARPHVLVLNKEDLVPKKNRDQIVEQIKMSDPLVSKVIFTNGKYGGCTGMKSVLPSAVKLINQSNRYHRTRLIEKSILIIGIPNVGKSTMINQLRHRHMFIGGKATATGAMPGVTRAVQERVRVSDDPLVFLLDTPGISKPNVRDMHVGMKLAVCNTLRDSVIGEDHIADYLLWYLNCHHKFDYVDYMGLSQPEDDIYVMLTKSAVANGLMTANRPRSNMLVVGGGGEQALVPCINKAAHRFLKGFREGRLGKMYLDQDALDQIGKSSHS